MENASKALIIAGSILLSILIIALGMFIFSNSSSTTDNMSNTLSENEKQTFNIKFEKYTGKQTGSSVKSLLSTVSSTGISNKEAADMIPSVETFGGNNDFAASVTGGVELTKDEDAAKYTNAIGTISGKVVNSHDYWVSLEYNGSGLVSKINIGYNRDDLPAGTVDNSQGGQQGGQQGTDGNI